MSKCPAAGQGLKWTKCPAVRNFHRIPTAGKILSNFLVVFDVFLKMQSDCKTYVGVQDDEITCAYYKISIWLTLRKFTLTSAVREI